MPVFKVLKEKYYQQKILYQQSFPSDEGKIKILKQIKVEGIKHH